MNMKLLERILAGSRSVRFADFVNLVEAYGFESSRIRGSHHNHSLNIPAFRRY
jgi:hypothetical protein